MSWHFSQALVEDYLQATSWDGEPFALWSSMPFALGDSCSDKMKETCHRSPFGTMYVPSMDCSGAALLTWFLEGFHVRHIPPQLEAGIMQTISGRKCGGSWQMSLPGTFLRRTSYQKPSTQLATILKRWVIKQKPLPLERKTWVLTTFGPEVGYLHTPTTMANYCAPSMQKHSCARAFVTVFGKVTPESHEWLMGWPIGWTDSKPLETGKFQLWQQQLYGHLRMMISKS
jgi:hypothetical protein